MHPIKVLTLLAAASLLAACGSGGGDETPQPPVAGNEVPASAYASTSAYRSYAGQLPASDGTEPLDVTRVVPPTTETEEPADV